MKKLEYDIESISPSLKRLASNYYSDQKSIKEYYKENSSKVKFSKWLDSNDIIGFIRRLFFLDYDGEDKFINLPSLFVYRTSRIYYTNIEDEYGNSIGYEGMRSFAITKSNLTNASLSYWLNQKSL